MNAPKMTEVQKTAIRSVEKALELLRSVQSLEGTDKDSMEYLLERALENVRADKQRDWRERGSECNPTGRRRFYGRHGETSARAEYDV